MTPDQLLQQIPNGQTEPFYFLYGSERAYQTEVIRVLKQKWITDENKDFNLETFDGQTSSAHSWIDSARTIPFLGGTKLVVVQNMREKFEHPEEDAHMAQIESGIRKDDDESNQSPLTKTRQEQDIQALIDYANAPCADTCLVITADKVDKRIKLLKALTKMKGAVSCEAPKEYELIPWVMRLAKNQGYSMSKNVAQTLVNRVGPRPGFLLKELEKTLVYTGRKKTVSEQDIAEVVGETKQEDTFALISALLEKNSDAVFKKLHNQMGYGEDPIKILGAISWQFRMIWEVKSYQKQGLSSAQIAKTIGGHPFAVDKASKHARKFSIQKLRECHAELVKADRGLKSNPDREGVMDTLVLNLCTILGANARAKT